MISKSPHIYAGELCELTSIKKRYAQNHITNPTFYVFSRL